jgi:UDP-glucuronate 4-epimerase
VTTSLVTGAAGFIGSHLVRELVASDQRVRAVDAFTDFGGVDRKRSNAAALLKEEDVRCLEIDLAEDDLGDVMADVDVLYHLAAQPGVRQSWGLGFTEYARNNVVGTQRVLDAATQHGVGRVVYASSSSVYGNALRHPTPEEVRPEPVSPYGVSKLAGEHICAAYVARGGPPVMVLRYFTVYGPGQRPDMALHRLFQTALGGPPFPRYGDGSQIRDITFVSDVVQATLAAGAATTEGLDVINVAGGTQISVNRLIELVGEIVGTRPTIEPRSTVAGDVQWTSAAADRAAEVLGWTAAVEVREGLAQQFAWHLERCS